MDKAGKSNLKEEIGQRLGKAKAVFLAEYRGLTVGELTQLRTELRKNDAEFKVSKNRIAKLAMVDGNEEFKPLSEGLTGPLGIVYSYGDVAQTAKSVLDFAKEHDKFVLKNGVLDGSVVDSADLKAIASLPSKEVLIAKALGSILAPHKGIVTVLSGVSRQLVQVINAIKDTKEQGS